MPEVVIVGGGFAGLAVARALGRQDAVLVDPHPIGAYVKSACALPLPVVHAFGAETSVREVHSSLVFHVDGAVVHQHADPPYATVDYTAFCHALMARSGVHVVRAHAVGYAPGRVLTTQGELPCRYAVDASGPRAVLASALRPGYAIRRFMGAGLEVEVPRPSGFPSGLHFYVDPDLPPGYAWAFGAGEHVRVGVYAYAGGRGLRKALQRLLQRLGIPLAASRPHGGLIPWRLRDPVVGRVLVVGDAAGQVLPMTAEGIRPALYYGTVLGRLLEQVLSGRMTYVALIRSYRAEIHRRRWAFGMLGGLQRFVGSVPPNVSGRLLELGQYLGLGKRLYRRYVQGFQGR
ncbi:FAD-dependent monooxygenase [Marinithermus hydrothermalis]|uniref:FAD dependent oxidoreductase n=1 Tax=Marinithermus hydrothermalis (strain DSM 14884 / JCM 11576 / T1) TaxID=869210 RepID=F2NLF2_MARHT|nr:NAD(P)/FAD-dependent oxidoreductase [Marinithermus hydrothermalis]AEB11771.1 FAD dependent oxidoreductase [Marinithermus hydrothermalis DSM 14884]